MSVAAALDQVSKAATKVADSKNAVKEAEEALEAVTDGDSTASKDAALEARRNVAQIEDVRTRIDLEDAQVL